MGPWQDGAAGLRSAQGVQASEDLGQVCLSRVLFTRVGDCFWNSGWAFPRVGPRSLQKQVCWGGAKQDDPGSPRGSENSCLSRASQPPWKAPTSCVLIRIVMGKRHLSTLMLPSLIVTTNSLFARDFADAGQLSKAFWGERIPEVLASGGA